MLHLIIKYCKYFFFFKNRKLFIIFFQTYYNVILNHFIHMGFSLLHNSIELNLIFDLMILVSLWKCHDTKGVSKIKNIITKIYLLNQ